MSELDRLGRQAQGEGRRFGCQDCTLVTRNEGKIVVWVCPTHGAVMRARFVK